MFGFIRLWALLSLQKKTDWESEELMAFVCDVGNLSMAIGACISPKCSDVCLYKSPFN